MHSKIEANEYKDYILGFIYEHLISNFAANAGKKAGEFYTPHEVSMLMSEIVSWHLPGRKNITIYNKIIYNYPLERFRASGYTKDFQNFATDTNLRGRTLIALILSEYRRYLFADLKLNIKPVIMLKSQKIKESEAFHDEFFKKLEELTSYKIKALQNANIPLLSKAIAYFGKKMTLLKTWSIVLKTLFLKVTPSSWMDL